MSKSDWARVRWRDVELKMIRSVLLENLLRFCLCFQPTNIPCLEESDAITVNCYQNNTTKTVGINPVWLIIGCWIILLDLFLVLLSAHSILADVPALALCSQILLINQVDNGTPGLGGAVLQCHINTLSLLIYWLVGRQV